MGLIISVYTKEAFREYLLPVINNADYALTLHKSFYGLRNDLSIALEIIEGEWRLCTSEDYHIFMDKERINTAVPLKNEASFRLVTAANDKIVVFAHTVKKPFTDYQKYNISGMSEITIGRNDRNVIIYNNHDLISGEHAVMRHTGGGWEIFNKSSNGIYVNGTCIRNSRLLQFGDYINIIGLHMVYMNGFLAIDSEKNGVSIRPGTLVPAVLKEEDEKSVPETFDSEPVRKTFHRAPRAIPSIENEAVEIEDPPKQQKGRRQPVLLTIGPSFTMAIPMLMGCLLMIYSARQSGGGTGLFMYSGLVMAGSSAIVGVFWAVLNMRYQNRVERENDEQRYEAYKNYLVRKKDEIHDKYEHNQNALREMYPDAASCLEYDDTSTMLWNRNSSHRDFIAHRIGIGDVDFQVPIVVAKEKFSVLPDALAEKPRQLGENFKTLYQVPILTDLLEHRLIGVAGGHDKAGAVEIAKILSAQIAANNSYTDVKLVYVYNEDNSADLNRWEFAKWLPHVWSEDRRFRYVASSKADAGDVFYEIVKILRKRSEEQDGRGEVLYKPHFVMFISDMSMAENELISKYIFDKHANYGLSVVVLADSFEHLPNACEYIIQNDENFQGISNISSETDQRIPVQFDHVDDAALEQFARRLSNLQVLETESGGEIPSTLTFFEMYHINTLPELKVEERWIKNRTYDNIKGLIGEKAGGVPCYMDVHEKYHGPHGLVAGTTGSGKSETLQTYMLSLAINYSPDDIGFFIIDYKGGGMANLFEGLPHMIGQISNLSGNQVRRAMVSIKSENRRRQRIFNEHDVNNINAYTKLYKNGEASEPVPHLFIIIDEFAELKKEEPDFMKELISVAQVGRSLGVHLILATQKPSGTVDDNIWSNSKFRLCLRVQDRQDSNDMLHKPDAAYITQAGRCYLQVGNDEVYELFQSGWSGAPYNENAESSKTEIARMISMTGKAEAVGSHARMARKEKELHDWIMKVAHCFSEVCKRRNVKSLSAVLEGHVNAEEFMDDVYGEMAAAGLDYPKGRYNTGRLMDFARIYEEAAMKRVPDTADYIIAQAALRSVKLPQQKEKTQLDAVKDYLARVAARSGYTHNHQLWLPVLPERLYLNAFEEYRNSCFADGEWKKRTGVWSLDLVMGLVDDPVNQAQVPLVVSYPECGHIAVIGTVVSGKSTFLQTMVYGLISGYSPQYVNIYAIDFSSKMMSAFENSAHVGGVMYETDLEKIGRFFTMIGRILEERKKIFRGGNYSQYVQVNGVKYPAIIILIDNYSAFKEKTKEAYEEMVVTLAKEGVSHGIFLVLSGAGFGMNEISNRIGESLKTVICLEMADKFAYSDALHTLRIDVLPEVGVKGRGLAYYGSRVLEFQTALALEADDDYQRMERISEYCSELNSCWSGRSARPVPSIPDEPVWDEFRTLEDVEEKIADPRYLPVGYNDKDAEIYSIDLFQTYCYLITGSGKSGKKNFMRIMILSALAGKADAAVLDPPAGPLHAFSKVEGVSYLTTEDEIFDYFMNTLTPVFKERNALKQKLLKQDYEDIQIFEEQLKQKSLFLFISDLSWFLDLVYNSTRGMSGFIETLFAKGSLHNIYFVGILSVDKKGSVSGYQAFQHFIKDKNGIHFGGNTMKNSIMDFSYLSFQEQNKVQKPGIGQLPDLAGEHPVEKIVVPAVKKVK